MIKPLYLFPLLILVCFSTCFTQQLPFQFDFLTGLFPTGWKTNGTSFYKNSGNPAPALKFDDTKDYLEIPLIKGTGELTFDICGNDFSGGIFTVEATGEAKKWKPIVTYTELTKNYQKKTVKLNGSYTHIRFIYSSKNVGNIGIDNLYFTKAPDNHLCYAQLSHQSKDLESTDTLFIQSELKQSIPFELLMENLGFTEKLKITAVELKKDELHEIKLMPYTSTIEPKKSSTIKLIFTPKKQGTRITELELKTSDKQHPIFKLYLVINGGLHEKITLGKIDLKLDYTKSYRAQLHIQYAKDYYLVLFKQGIENEIQPENGKSYKRGDLIGSYKVLSSGADSIVLPKHIVANSSYHFKVFKQDGLGPFLRYSTDFKTLFFKTPDHAYSTNYYADLDVLSSNFPTKLCQKVQHHKTFEYGDYIEFMVNGYYENDTNQGKKFVRCVYSDVIQYYSGNFDFTSTGFSREHTYCHSWMPTHPAQGRPEYSDFHHLFLTHQTGANGVRSNYPLGEVVKVEKTFGNCEFGKDEKGNTVFEPSDLHKGRAARALLYMLTAYQNQKGEQWKLPKYISTSIPFGQSIETLLNWHFSYPPSNEEKAVNDYLDSLQGNRNPFVDNPIFAAYIDFETFHHQPNGFANGLQTSPNAEIRIFPNPAQTIITISAKNDIIKEIQFFGSDGKVISEPLKNNTLKEVTLSTEPFKKGIYLIHVKTSKHEINQMIHLQ